MTYPCPTQHDTTLDDKKAQLESLLLSVIYYVMLLCDIGYINVQASHCKYSCMTSFILYCLSLGYETSINRLTDEDNLPVADFFIISI